MRMRKRRNLSPRMEKCAAVLLETPEDFRGQWLSHFNSFSHLQLELGCGKGRFTADTAEAQPDTLLVAVEKVPDAMIIAMERILDRRLPNVRFIDTDAARLPLLFAPGEVERIYINFCDPWPKSRDAKFRLTAPAFLRLYADALPPGGEIWFKTDNAPLFDWSVRQLQDEGWAISELTNDLHANGPVGVMTDYETKFYAEGVKIHRLVAARTAETKTTADGPVPRLRDAALPDARGFKAPADGKLRLLPSTKELCRAYYQVFEHDPALFEDESQMVPYVYDEAEADARFERRRARVNNRPFYILVGEQVIGEVVLKNLNAEEKSCELGICLVNDRWKNRGYGTAAERLALDYAFHTLGMETVYADALLKNTRSQHVLQKLGFRYISEDEHFKFFRLTREDYLSHRNEGG